MSRPTNPTRCTRPGNAPARLAGSRGGGAAALAAALFLAAGARAAWAQNELFVTNQNANSVTVYAQTANGNAAPLRTISGAATGLNNPVGLAVDTVNNEVLVASAAGRTIKVFPLTANGNVAPLRTISGALTGLSVPVGLVVDPLNNELMVADFGNRSLAVFSRTANGDVAPLRTISGAATGLNGPEGLVLDTVNNELAVANFATPSITVYARTANGNVAPLRTISGVATGLKQTFGLALDIVNNELAVVNNGPAPYSVTVYARTANGNVAPLRTISGAATGLNQPVGLAVDTSNNELAVANNIANTVTVYPRTAVGNVAPLRTISGAATGLSAPFFLAIATGASPPPGANYYPLTPCRILDTRNPVGPYGGPSLSAGGSRDFVLAGVSAPCGIPSTATAVAINLVVVSPTDGPGFLAIDRAGAVQPPTSTINYNAGRARANNAVVSLGPGGDVAVFCRQRTGTVDLIVDVSGYFQ